MRKGLIAAAIGAATVISSVGVAGSAFASVQPHRGPVAPGRSVTATLVNSTPCTLQLTGGTVADGGLTQSVPLTIGPYSSGTWKITGGNAFGPDDAADLAVVFNVTGCAQAGEQEGYAMQNTDAQGLWYTANACAVSPAPGLRNTFTAVPAYHATLTITLTTANTTAKAAAAVTGLINRPQLGTCGGLPLS